MMSTSARQSTAIPTGKRPLLIRWRKKIRPFLNDLIARSSRVPNAAVLDPARFAWTKDFRQNWEAIRQEALSVLVSPDALPALQDISSDHQRFAVDEGWQSFVLIGHGQRIEQNLERCPVTAPLLDRVPGLNSGFFSVLRPGTHIPRHRGVTKALLTCHLSLHVPEEGRRSMAIGPTTVGWKEGTTLVFDDTWPHEVWNDTSGTMIVLLIQFQRLLDWPGRILARLFLAAIRRSAFVAEAKARERTFARNTRQP